MVVWILLLLRMFSVAGAVVNLPALEVAGQGASWGEVEQLVMRGWIGAWRYSNGAEGRVLGHYHGLAGLLARASGG